MEVFLIYPVFLFIGVAIAELANQKGYSGKWWFVISCVLPLVSIPILLILKKKARKNKIRPDWMQAKVMEDKVLYVRKSE